MEARAITVDGRRVRYLVAGSGPPLLLLHALGESGGSWREVLPALADRSTVYAPDLPGFGHSDPLDEPPSAAALARAARAFLDAAVPDGVPAGVIGSSLGGAVAIELALADPARVDRLVLVDSAGLGRAVHPALCALAVPGYGELLAAAGTTPLGATARAWLRVPFLISRPRLAPPEWLEEQRRLATRPAHMRTTLRALRAQVGPFGQRRSLVGDLPRLAMPTLVVWGADDVIFPPAHGRRAVPRLPSGRLELLPACGHLPYLERPEAFVAALDRFLPR